MSSLSNKSNNNSNNNKKIFCIFYLLKKMFWLNKKVMFKSNISHFYVRFIKIMEPCSEIILDLKNEKVEMDRYINLPIFLADISAFFFNHYQQIRPCIRCFILAFSSHALQLPPLLSIVKCFHRLKLIYVFFV